MLISCGLNTVTIIFHEKSESHGSFSSNPATMFFCTQKALAAKTCYVVAGGGGANTKVPDMYGIGGVFSGPKTQK